MNRADRRAIEPLIERWERDFESGNAKLRYDPAADILTVVVYRPEDAITFEDSVNGAYVDFDPAQRRFSAVTILGFRGHFLPLHRDMADIAWRSRLAWRIAGALDTFLGWTGVDMDRYWDHFLKSADARDALRRYNSELKDNPDRLGGLRGTGLLSPQPA